MATGASGDLNFSVFSPVVQTPTALEVGWTGTRRGNVLEVQVVPKLVGRGSNGVEKLEESCVRAFCETKPPWIERAARAGVS